MYGDCFIIKLTLQQLRHITGGVPVPVLLLTHERPLFVNTTEH